MKSQEQAIDELVEMIDAEAIAIAMQEYDWTWGLVRDGFVMAVPTPDEILMFSRRLLIACFSEKYSTWSSGGLHAKLCDRKLSIRHELVNMTWTIWAT